MAKMILGLLLLVAGCAASDPAFLGSNGSVTVGGTTATYYTGDQRVFLLVWHDFGIRAAAEGHHTSGGTGSSAARTTVDGQFSVFGEDPRLVWHGETVDGRTGEVLINGTAYDLAAGNVFLVHDGENGAEVSQLALEIPAEAVGADGFAALAGAHPAVQLFLERAR